jgi:hypothetical protein
VWQQIGGQLLKAKERLATNLMVYLCARGFTLQFSIKEFANVLVSPLLQKLDLKFCSTKLDLKFCRRLLSFPFSVS